MVKYKNLSIHLTPELYDLIHEECENNGWKHSVAIKIGFECFMAASRENRIALLKKFNKRNKP